MSCGYHVSSDSGATFIFEMMEAAVGTEENQQQMKGGGGVGWGGAHIDVCSAAAFHHALQRRPRMHAAKVKDALRLCEGRRQEKQSRASSV